MKRTSFVAVFCVVLMLFVTSASFAVDIAETTDVALENISEVLSKNLNSSQTFGKPVYAGDYIVIPVISKCVVFGYGSKLEDFGQKYKSIEKTKKAEKKAKDRITLGAAGVSRPVALIFISKSGDFKVVKMNEGIASQLAKYIVPQIPNFIKEAINYKNKLMKRYKKKKHPKNNTKKCIRKIILISHRVVNVVA